MKVENGTSSILYTFNKFELNQHDAEIRKQIRKQVKQEIAKLKKENERLKLIEKLCIVPKFKIGQEVWYVYDKQQNVPFKFIVKGFYHSDISNSFLYISDDYITFEKYLFATKEEAELKLKELQK